MSVDDALCRLSDGGQVSRAEIRWILAHWEEAGPSLVSRLRVFAADGIRSSAAGMEAFFAVHLCAEQGERAAFSPLCRMIANDPAIDRWLGDAVTETLPGILISTFDGDVAILQQAIESPNGYEFARASALLALAYLVRAEAVVDEAGMRAYMRRLLREMKPRGESIVWMAWAMCAADLGYADMRSDVIKLDNEERIPERDFSPQLFDRQIELVRDDPSGLAGFRADLIHPLDDAVDALHALNCVCVGAPYACPTLAEAAEISAASGA